MTVGWYAPFVLIVCLGLWFRGSILGSVIAVLFFSLFGGGAAFILGGANIQPTYLALVFLLAHLLLSMFNRSSHANLGLKTNGYLAFFCIYGAYTAFVLPKIFFKQMEVPPVSINNAFIYYTAPLAPSSQNLTTALYLVATLVASICAGAATLDPKSRRTLVQWAVIMAWIHIGFGVFGVIVTKIGQGHILSFFRNAHYAELTETTGGFLRITGVFPEPSAYGDYAVQWFALMVELWLRGVNARWTGRTAAALLVMLAACTSSSAYFGLGAYLFVVGVRWALAPNGLRTRNLVIIGFAGLTAMFVAAALIALSPDIATAVSHIIQNATARKLQSQSGVQRLFWVKAGFQAFIVSRGLGVGAGSFRCSSLIVSILGSTGVIGTVAFLAHVIKILRPLRAQTYRLKGIQDPVGVSFAWAACAGMLPAMVSAPTPDPSITFAIFGGLSLGWRYLSEGDQPLFSRAATAKAQPVAEATQPVTV